MFPTCFFDLSRGTKKLTLQLICLYSVALSDDGNWRATSFLKTELLKVGREIDGWVKFYLIHCFTTRFGHEPTPCLPANLIEATNLLDLPVQFLILYMNKLKELWTSNSLCIWTCQDSLNGQHICFFFCLPLITESQATNCTWTLARQRWCAWDATLADDVGGRGVRCALTLSRIKLLKPRQNLLPPRCLPG